MIKPLPKTIHKYPVYFQ